METRQQWGTRAGFIFAAVGSAVGLETYGVFLIQRMKMEEAHSFTVLIRIINDWYFIVSIRICSWAPSPWFSTTYVLPYSSAC